MDGKERDIEEIIIQDVLNLELEKGECDCNKYFVIEKVDVGSLYSVFMKGESRSFMLFFFFFSCFWWIGQGEGRYI